MTACTLGVAIDFSKGYNGVLQGEASVKDRYAVKAANQIMINDIRRTNGSLPSNPPDLTIEDRVVHVVLLNNSAGTAPQQFGDITVPAGAIQIQATVTARL